MDENFFLVKQVDEALLDSQLFLMIRIYLGQWGEWFLSDCKEELDEVFGETNTERNDAFLQLECFLFIDFLKQANIFVYSLLMMMIMTSSLLVMQNYLHEAEK